MPTGRPGESLNATNYAKGGKSRMPYLDYRFYATSTEVKVGTPLGGMIYVTFTGIPRGLEIPITVSGAVDTPYYDLGKTTKEEWEIAKNAPGLYAEFRTPLIRFAVPASQIRNIEDPKDVLTFWNNAAATSTYAFNSTYRTQPISIIFDTYIPAGAAVAFVGCWYCICPTSWGESSLNYNTVTQSGCWGTIHEFNHHWQGVYGKNGQWGIGSPGEETNNVMNVASYLLYTNIACNRSETNNLGGWNTSADPYYNLKSVVTNSGINNLYKYATFMHEFGVENMLEVVKSCYSGGTYNGIQLSTHPAADGNNATVRNNDLAYRMSVIFGKDLSMYIKDVLRWELTQEGIQNIKALGFEEYIPVQNLYACGVKGVETGRPFFIPRVDSYTFNFEEYTSTPGEVQKIEVGTPKYGTLAKQEDGTYLYTPNYETIGDNYEEFELNITVTQNGVTNKRTLPVKIGFNYQSCKIEKYEISSRDLNTAIEESKNLTPYATLYGNSVNYTPDNGINLTKGSGYITVPEDGEYEFQVYGDDKVKFILEVEGEEHTSATSTYTSNVTQAYEHSGSTHFKVNLKAGELYSYTLYCYNNGGAGKAYATYRKDGTGNFTYLQEPYLRKEDYGKQSKKIKVQPENPKYIRKLVTPDNRVLVDYSNASVIKTPNAQSGSNGPEVIIDRNTSNFFHSKYSGGGITPFPHEYVIDLGSEQSFNQIDIATRTSNTNGTIGNYEIYISNDNENWEKVAEDNSRYGNSSAPVNITAKLSNPVNARYVKVSALNNRGGSNFTIVAEITLSTSIENKNYIAQNSSLIKYEGLWERNIQGNFINGATYNSTNGIAKLGFEGTEIGISSRKDATVQIKIDDEEWQTQEIKKSKNSPSLIINNLEQGKHNIKIQVLSGELAIDYFATNGTFTKYNSAEKEEVLTLTSEKYKIGDQDNTNYPNEYVIGDKYIYKVAPNTTLADFKSNLQVTEGAEIKVYKEENEITDTDLVGTGMKLIVQKENCISIELEIGVTGDVNGNGRIDIGDVTITVENIQITDKDLTGIYKKAGDINENERIDIGDLTHMVVYIQTNNFIQ